MTGEQSLLGCGQPVPSHRGIGQCDNCTADRNVVRGSGPGIHFQSPLNLRILEIRVLLKIKTIRNSDSWGPHLCHNKASVGRLSKGERTRWVVQESWELMVCRWGFPVSLLAVVSKPHTRTFTRTDLEASIKSYSSSWRTTENLLPAHDHLILRITHKWGLLLGRFTERIYREKAILPRWLQ